MLINECSSVFSCEFGYCLCACICMHSRATIEGGGSVDYGHLRFFRPYVVIYLKACSVLCLHDINCSIVTLQ